MNTLITLDQPLHWLILIVTGVVAGFVNTLAGGGSVFTLPALMLLGMPADVANATNRVGVLMQCVTAVRGFAIGGVMRAAEMIPIVLPSVAGGLVGAVLASWMPVAILTPALLVSLVVMMLVMLVRPSAIAPPPGTPVRHWQTHRQAAWGLFVAGVYGGFVQAGVGFILLSALAGALRYDLLRANALKMMATLLFTSVALVIFIARGQVAWLPGAVLAGATMIGAHLSVKWAIRVDQRALKWVLFIMALVVCGAALLKANW